MPRQKTTWAGRAALQAAAAVTAIAVAAPALSADPKYDRPREMDPAARSTDYTDIFKADPTYEETPYDANRQIDIYGGKRNIEEPRPVLEIGQPQYVEGPFGQTDGFRNLGEKNPFNPAVQVFGDFRTAVAANDIGDDLIYEWRNRLNLDIDLKLTSTERIHAFLRPLDRGGKFIGFQAGDRNDDDGGDGFEGEVDGGIETLFFEGDIGAIVAGITDEYQTYDLPFSFGLMPFLTQNGLWTNDAFVGGAFAIPSQNSATLDITNMDFTFFAGFTEVDSPALVAPNGDPDTDDTSIYGVAAFIEWYEGYSEFGVAYVDGRNELSDIDYVNVTAAFTRRYGGWLSNSVRLFGAFGQDTDNRPETAEGFALLVENSFITSKPNTFIPYLNGWIGIDKPQSLARDAGNLLLNTGITFENDGITKFPKLDDTAQDTFGAAVGINYLFSLDQQLVVEASTVQTLEGDNEPGQPAQGSQYGVGFRYQIPVTNRVILRADGIYGIRENQDDIAGLRFEVRVKF